jgi:hypothetical protein
MEKSRASETENCTDFKVQSQNHADLLFSMLKELSIMNLFLRSKQLNKNSVFKFWYVYSSVFV